MSKGALTSPPANLIMPESLAAEIDKISSALTVNGFAVIGLALEFQPT